MIGKKWIYSDSERSTPHRQSVGHLRGQVRLWNVVWLVFMDWVISCANEWEDYSSNFGEGVEISRNWATDLWLVFWQGLGTVAVPLVVGLPSLLSWWRIHLRCRRPGFDPWFGKIPWRGERLPTLVFWPGEFHGLCSPWSQRVRHDWATFTSLHFILQYKIKITKIKVLNLKRSGKYQRTKSTLLALLTCSFVVVV